MTIHEFLESRGIGMRADRIGHNPNFDPQTDQERKWEREASHWHCEFLMSGRTFNVDYSQGAGHNIVKYAGTNMERIIVPVPTTESVLDCVASDCRSLEPSRSLTEWASDMDWPAHSVRARQCYETIRSEARRLEIFLGRADYDILIHHVEPL